MAGYPVVDPMYTPQNLTKMVHFAQSTQSATFSAQCPGPTTWAEATKLKCKYAGTREHPPSRRLGKPCTARLLPGGMAEPPPMFRFVGGRLARANRSPARRRRLTTSTFCRYCFYDTLSRSREYQHHRMGISRDPQFACPCLT